MVDFLKSKQHLKWSGEALQGLTYLYTSKGPMKDWLKKVKRADSDECFCGEVQNVEHLHGGCGDLVPCSKEDMWREEAWCEQVVWFLRGR